MMSPLLLDDSVDLELETGVILATFLAISFEVESHLLGMVPVCTHTIVRTEEWKAKIKK